VLESLNVTCGVDHLIAEEAIDEVVAEFIKAGKVKFENDALAKIYELPETLSTYLVKHEKSIIDEFDIFFDVYCQLQIVEFSECLQLMDMKIKP